MSVSISAAAVGYFGFNYAILDTNRRFAARETKTMLLDRSASERRSKESALAALYDEYYDKIARYIFVRLGDRAEAEDLAGEVFLKALESLGSYKERGVPMQAWLFRIAHNLVVDHFRRAAKRKTVPIDDLQVASDIDPQEAAEASIEVARISRALDQLTPAQRQTIELRFFGELSSEEAGQVMKKGAGAVRELQCAAIRTLRKLLYEGKPSEGGE
ncbi:MAG: sigma-70 family RNA polymerase sigma factor [Dehalococcoidia bacterium]